MLLMHHLLSEDFLENTSKNNRHPTLPILFVNFIFIWNDSAHLFPCGGFWLLFGSPARYLPPWLEKPQVRERFCLLCSRQHRQYLDQSSTWYKAGTQTHFLKEGVKGKQKGEWQHFIFLSPSLQSLLKILGLRWSINCCLLSCSISTLSGFCRQTTRGTIKEKNVLNANRWLQKNWVSL